jgi:GNAT superfamily N-acetyltransferase
MAPLAPNRPSAPLYQIHHYPTALIETRALGPAGQLTLRPVLPQDDQLLAELVSGLSTEARRNRFHGRPALPFAQLQGMCRVDPELQLALVVSAHVDGTERLIADARYGVDDDGQGAEFAVMVSERWQRHGVGRWAMGALQRAATRAGLVWLHGEVLQANTPMVALMQRCGFALSADPEDEHLLHAQHRLGLSVAESPPAPRSVVSWLRQVLPPSRRRSSLSR